jgi:hypothetical protein
LPEHACSAFIASGRPRSALSHFESNLSLLATRQPELAVMLGNTSNHKVRVFPSVSGLPTACWDGSSSSIALHSQYDPLREARQKLKSQPHEGTDYFIFLGFGLGYMMDVLLEESRDSSNYYFIVESDLEILRAAFEARDLSPILALPNVHFAWPVAGPDLAEQWRNFFSPVYAQKSTFLTHLSAISLNPGLFKAAAEIIQSQTFQIFTDINTLVAKSQDFLDNFVQNLLKAAASPGVVKLAGKFSNVPAVIVSAGPSLDKNIHELRGCEDKMLILSTDTALKPLLSAGIDPHFVLTGDPSHVNYLHLKGSTSKQALFVAEATSYPAVFTEFEGRTISCIFENSSLRSLSDLLGNKGTLRAWGSVATMALDFALMLQCNPIVFIGQDLAHTDGRIYCSGVCFDEKWFADITDPAQWETQLKKLRADRRTVMVEDIFGKPIESTDILTSYWNWMIKEISRHPDVRFINATEGGILKEGAEIASLREVLYRYCSKDLGLCNRIRDNYRDAQKNNLLYSGLDLSVLVGEIMALQDTLKLGSKLCRENTGYSPQDLMKRLESTKRSIYFNPHLAPLIDSFNQMGNVNFLRKQRTVSQKTQSASLMRDVRNLYSEYFNSVREALTKIKSALSKIESNLKLESGNSPSQPPLNTAETPIPTTPN